MLEQKSCAMPITANNLLLILNHQLGCEYTVDLYTLAVYRQCVSYFSVLLVKWTISR